MEKYSARNYVSKKLPAGTKVLLVNAPVVETRYQWVRWNQPLDLLKIGTLLRDHHDCDVRLFDFMLPKGGTVARTANRNVSAIDVGGYQYSLWRYGRPFEDLAELFDKPKDGWLPDEVWISTLTSYWWKGIHNTVGQLKNLRPDLKVCLYGLYPTLETSHAKRNTFADVLLTGALDLKECRAAFDLYRDAKLDFRALDMRSSHWIEQVLDGIEVGVSDYVFFNDDVLGNAEDCLLKGMQHIREFVNGRKKTWCRFHGICGIEPRHFTVELAKELLALPESRFGFVSMHFEHTRVAGELDLDVYRRVKEAYDRAGVQLDPDQFSGFIDIGLHDDNLDRIVTELLNLHEVFSTVILKPHTPSPGADDYERHKQSLPVTEIEKLSPHCFPLTTVNGIPHEEYEDLYALAAMLNKKVRSKGFDLFPGRLAHEMIRTSLEREVWNLGEPQSATD